VQRQDDRLQVRNSISRSANTREAVQLGLAGLDLRNEQITLGLLYEGKRLRRRSRLADHVELNPSEDVLNGFQPQRERIEQDRRAGRAPGGRA
jgi:hypothetical protein